jgi:D-alanine-D-alanine ligase
VKPRRIVILYGEVAPGAPPDEQDVLVEVEAVEKALKRLGHTVERVPLTLDLLSARVGLRQLSPDLVFNLVESIEGKGAWACVGPMLLDAMHLPYTGSGLSGMVLSGDKLFAKRVMEAAGIPTAPWMEAETAVNGIGADQRFIIKSITEHASIGIDDDSVIDLAAVHETLAARGSGWFAEAYIEGREFNVSVLEGPGGPQVLPIAEIVFDDFPAGKPRIVNYAAKWQEDSFDYRHTRRVFPPGADDRELHAMLVQAALACWRHFEQRGYTRVDFRVDAMGRTFVLETNANPCISPDAGLAAAAAQAGLSYVELIERIVLSGLRR